MTGSTTSGNRPGVRVERAPGWGKELVLRELRAGTPLKPLCVRYAGEASPQSLRTEVSRWEFSDPEWGREYRAIVGPAPPHASREDLDPEGTANWRLLYCEELYRTANEHEACKVTPYAYNTIYKMLNPSYPEYDAGLAEMVQEIRVRLCAEMQARIVSAIRDPETPARDAAWIGFRWLERQDPTRWGKQVEMIHSGTIKHEAIGPSVSKEDRLSALLESQEQFRLEQAKKRMAIPARAASADMAEAAEVVEGELLDE